MPEQRLGSIFISYRRDDSADIAGRIYDRLVQRFGEDSVFKDVDSIPLGVDFRKYISESVGQCAILLAIIGPKWATIRGANWRRRLDNLSDFVRIEIETALQRNIPVIPLLVQGATMPDKKLLPTSLQSLIYRNGAPIRHDPDFHRDMDRLISDLEVYLKQRSERSTGVFTQRSNVLESPVKFDSIAYIEPSTDTFNTISDDSIWVYSETITAIPEDKFAYFHRGSTYYEQNKYDQALADFTQVIKLDPQYIYAYNYRGLVYFHQNRLEEALADFNQAVELKPKLALLYINRGNVYHGQRKLDQALADYNQAIKLSPRDAAAYNNRGIVYFEQNSLEQALADHNQAIKLDRKYVSAYINRGYIYYAQDKLDQAAADYNQAIKLDRNSAHAYYNRGLMHLKNNNRTAAITDFEQARDLSEHPEARQDAINELKKLGA